MITLFSVHLIRNAIHSLLYQSSYVYMVRAKGKFRLYKIIPMKLHLPYTLRAALLAALLCCTTAFGTVTVTVDDQNSSLEELSGTPSGSVSIEVEGEDATLSKALRLNGDENKHHSISVGEGASLTIRGGITYDGWRDYYEGEWVPSYDLSLSLFNGAKIIFASGESRLGGVDSSAYQYSAELVVQKGAKLTLRDCSFAPGLTIEEGGELIAGDNVWCSSLNGKGTLRFAGSVEDWYDGEISIIGTGGKFEGIVEGRGDIDVASVAREELFLPAEQTFTNVIAKETELSTSWCNVVLSGSKNEFQMINLGDVYAIGYDAFSHASVPQITDTLSIEAGTKVLLGKFSFSVEDIGSDPEAGNFWDSSIDAPLVQRGLSFRMEDRSKLVMKYGKGETGAKITASAAINLTTTTWEGHGDPTKLAVRVEFAENPGKDLKQLLIQSNGIVLTSMMYSQTGDMYSEDYTTWFRLGPQSQYTDENSEDELNKWLKENVTVTVDGYDDPYLMVEKKDGNVVQLYVIAGDGANLPDAPIEPIPDDPNPDTIFAPLAISENTRTGAGMLYHAMNYSTSSELRNVAGVIAELAQIGQGGQPAVAMAAMIAESGITERLIEETNIDPAAARSEAQRLMSAVVGSAVPALGAAQRDAMRGQLSRAASRAARLGQEPAARDDSDQGMRVWVEGMGGSAKLDRSGDETGYEHNSWGAGVGVEKDLQGGGPIIGLSLVASYGDLKVDAADHAEGDLDTYYVNLYAHHRSGNFHHSFVVSAGFSDAEFNRTIRGGVAPYVLDYATSGSTNGAGFGAAYELAYDISLNEQKSSLLQPLIGLSVITTKMDGYNENGAGDAGLHVGEQKSTLTTLTAGARFVSQCGEQTFSRAAVLEIRANVAVDMGDRRSEADVSFLGDRGYSGRVRSAETGVVGAQLGASVSIPVDRDTLLYVNGEADLRSGSNSWSVGGGVSIAF